MKPVSPEQISIIQEKYANFHKACLNKTERVQDVKRDFVHLNKQFFYSNMQPEFLERTSRLGETLAKNGDLDMASILLGQVGKIFTNKGMVEAAERVISITKEIYEKFGDKLHVFARLTDLEFLYKNVGNRQKVYGVLKEKIKCAKEILKDYDKYCDNFKSRRKEPLSEIGIKKQMAIAYTDMAYIIAPKNPDLALDYLAKAKNIYESNGFRDEVAYITNRINNTISRFCADRIYF